MLSGYPLERVFERERRLGWTRVVLRRNVDLDLGLGRREHDEDAKDAVKSARGLRSRMRIKGVGGSHITNNPTRYSTSTLDDVSPSQMEQKGNERGKGI